ncbi:unnamed protein product [Prunus brigantina]
MVRLHNLFILTALIIFCFFSSPAIGTTGSATYYNPPYTPSACFGRRDSGHMVAAASYMLYNRRAICGRRYKVTCLTAAYSKGRNPCKANNVVYVTVVDLCPGCQAQQLDLSREAFAPIAGLGAGRIKIYFQPV